MADPDGDGSGRTGAGPSRGSVAQEPPRHHRRAARVSGGAGTRRSRPRRELVDAEAARPEPSVRTRRANRSSWSSSTTRGLDAAMTEVHEFDVATRSGAQRHRAVDDPVGLDQGDGVDADLGEVGPDLADPGLGVGLGGEPAAGVVGGDGRPRAPEASSSRQDQGRSAAVGCRNVGGCSGRFTAQLADRGLDERRRGELEDLAAAADVDADLGVGGDDRGEQGEADALLPGRRERAGGDLAEQRRRG